MNHNTFVISSGDPTAKRVGAKSRNLTLASEALRCLGFVPRQARDFARHDMKKFPTIGKPCPKSFQRLENITQIFPMIGKIGPNSSNDWKNHLPRCYGWSRSGTHPRSKKRLLPGFGARLCPTKEDQPQGAIICVSHGRIILLRPPEPLNTEHRTPNTSHAHPLAHRP